jgi:biopolymer transport protein TolR
MASVVNNPRSARASRGRHGRPMSEINVTPFVDVMLVLLIVVLW